MPDILDLSIMGAACFEWLRTRKLPCRVALLPNGMGSIEALLQDAHRSFSSRGDLASEQSELAATKAELAATKAALAGLQGINILAHHGAPSASHDPHPLGGARTAASSSARRMPVRSIAEHAQLAEAEVKAQVQPQASMSRQGDDGGAGDVNGSPAMALLGRPDVLVHA